MKQGESGHDRRRRSGFLGAHRLDAQGVDAAGDEIAKRLIDGTMARQVRLTGESGRHDQQAIMPTAAACASVTGVPRRVVDQLEASRRQGRQAPANDRFETALLITRGEWLAHAGKAFLNGLTDTLSYTPAAT